MGLMRTFKFEANELQYLFLLILFQIAKSLIWSAYEINIGLLYLEIYVWSIQISTKVQEFLYVAYIMKENILNLI